MSFHGDEYELAMGSARGLRAFDQVDGVMHSPVNFTRWQDGENASRCATGGKHRFSDDCTCGFYSYHDGRNTYAESNPIQTVVENYGKVVIGDSGFRAEKSKIVAAYVLHNGPKEPKTPVVKTPVKDTTPFAIKIGRKFGENGTAPAGVMSSILSIMALSIAVPLVITVSTWFALFAIPVIAFGFLASCFYRADFDTEYGYVVQKARRRVSSYSFSIGPDPLTKDEYQQLKSNYPSVKWFNSPEEMLKAFPLYKLDKVKSSSTMKK